MLTDKQHVFAGIVGACCAIGAGLIAYLAVPHESTASPEVGVWQQVKVVEVIDGDTIKAKQKTIKYEHLEDRYTIRFSRLDAPELETEAGQEARRALVNMLGGRTVRVRWGDDEGRLRGHYGRLLARVHVDGKDAGEWMADQGHGRLAF